MISTTFVEAKNEVLKSILRDRRRQVHNEDLRTKLDYYGEEYDEEREMELRPVCARETTYVLQTGSLRAQIHRGRVVEFKDAPNMNGRRVERESDKRRPSEQRVEKATLTSGYGGNQPSTNSGGNFPPNAILLKILPGYGRLDKKQILGLHEEQHISGFVHGLKTKSFMEFLSTDIPTTYKGPIEKTYIWIEAKKVAINGDPSDHKEGFDRGNHLPPVLGSENSSDSVIIRVRISGRQVNWVTQSGLQDPTYRFFKRAFMASRRGLSGIHDGGKSLYKDINPELCHHQVQFSLQPSPRKNIYAENGDLIPRTITVGRKPFNTEHKLNEYKHIKPVKQKKRGLAPERNKAAYKEVDELTKAGILREVKYQTW
ncbi:hypothetical protein Tco_0548297 [Tanacetum coccineum]